MCFNEEPTIFGNTKRSRTKERFWFWNKCPAECDDPMFWQQQSSHMLLKWADILHHDIHTFQINTVTVLQPSQWHIMQLQCMMVNIWFRSSHFEFITKKNEPSIIGHKQFWPFLLLNKIYYTLNSPLIHFAILFIIYILWMNINLRSFTLWFRFWLLCSDMG